MLVTDGSGCDTTLSITIDQTDELTVSNITGTSEGCIGDGTGSASVVAAGGVVGVVVVVSVDGVVVTAGSVVIARSVVSVPEKA